MASCLEYFSRLAVFANYSGTPATGTGGSIALITTSTNNIESFGQRGLQQQRFSWREIR